jgi:hypothetical protein
MQPASHFEFETPGLEPPMVLRRLCIQKPLNSQKEITINIPISQTSLELPGVENVYFIKCHCLLAVEILLQNRKDDKL